MSGTYGNYGENDGGGGFPSQFSMPPPSFHVNNSSSKSANWAGNCLTGGVYNDGRGNVGAGAGGNSFNNGGGIKGSFSKGYGGGDMITQEDTIFVSGMDLATTEQDIQNHFGAIGVIKKDKKTMKPKIWLYKNKETGLFKGEATVTYDDTNAAQSAISWFDGHDFKGTTIRVSLAQRQSNWTKSGGGSGSGSGPPGRGFIGNRNSTFGGQQPSGGERGGHRGLDRKDGHSGGAGRDDRSSRFGNSSNSRGGVSGGSGIPQREGDWICQDCSNTNFSWRNECNRCKSPKPNASAEENNYSQGGGGNFRNDRRMVPGNSRGGNSSDNFDGRSLRESGGSRGYNGGGRAGYSSGVNGRRDGNSGGPMRQGVNVATGPVRGMGGGGSMCGSGGNDRGRPRPY